MPRHNRSGIEAGLISLRAGYCDRREVFYYIEPKQLGQITAWLAGTEVGRTFTAPPIQVPDSDDRSA